MYKYDLKNNPELAKERKNAQNREWYKRNKEKVMEMQRKRRKKLKEQKSCGQVFTYTTEMHQMPHDEYIKQLLKRADELRNVRND